jgi:hypothetical protein
VLALLRVQRVECAHVVVAQLQYLRRRQCETWKKAGRTDGEVGAHAALIFTLRDDDHTVLHAAREQNLRGIGVVRFCDTDDILVVEQEGRLAGRWLACAYISPYTRTKKDAGIPIGEYAVSTIPFSFAYVRSASSGRHGCSSTWFVAGTTLTRESAASCLSRGTPKFDTPRVFTFPAHGISKKNEGEGEGQGADRR